MAAWAEAPLPWPVPIDAYAETPPGPPAPPTAPPHPEVPPHAETSIVCSIKEKIEN